MPQTFADNLHSETTKTIVVGGGLVGSSNFLKLYLAVKCLQQK